MKMIIEYVTLTSFVFTTCIILTLTSISFKITQSLTQLFLASYQPTQISQHTFEFIHNQLDITQLETFINNYTAVEVAHLLDVQKLVLSTKLIWIATTLIFVSQYHLFTVNSSLRKIAIINLLLIVAGTCAGVLYWNNLFILFHQVLFPPNTWSFPINSQLIQNFPVLFWQISALGLIIYFALMNLLILSWSKIKLFTSTKRTKGPKNF